MSRSSESTNWDDHSAHRAVALARTRRALAAFDAFDDERGMHEAGVAVSLGGGAGGPLDPEQAFARFLARCARNHAEVCEDVVRLDRREEGEADAPARHDADADDQQAGRERQHQVAVNERAGDHAPQRPLAEPAEAFVEPSAEA